MILQSGIQLLVPWVLTGKMTCNKFLISSFVFIYTIFIFQFFLHNDFNGFCFAILSTFTFSLFNFYILNKNRYDTGVDKTRNMKHSGT